MTASEKQGTLKTVENAFEILKELLEQRGAGVTELARRLDMPKGTVHAYLRTLHNEGIVINDGDGYRVSLKLFEMSGRVRDEVDLYSYGRDSADQLAEKTGELVHLGIEQQGVIYYMYRGRGSSAMKTTTPVGHARPIHATAAGKAILAGLPEEETMTLLDQCDFEKLTEHTISSREELLSQLRHAETQGYAMNDQEEIIGSRTVAVQVSAPQQDSVGAICLSGPASRLDESYVSELVPQLKEVANRIEVNFQRE
jgi:DNA-binding IclR family transcriptional regulator